MNAKIDGNYYPVIFLLLHNLIKYLLRTFITPYTLVSPNIILFKWIFCDGGLRDSYD